MTIEWVLLFIILIMAALLVGLCIVLVAFHASRRHEHLIHIALVAAGTATIYGYVVGQIIASFFGTQIPRQVGMLVFIAAMLLHLAGLIRMYWHRNDERKLQR